MADLAQDVPEAPSLVPSTPSPAENLPSLNDEAVDGILQPLVDSEIFTMVQAIGSVTGAAVMVVVVFSVIRNITQGAFGLAVRSGVFGAIVAAMLFNLRVPIGFAQGLTSVVEQVFTFLLDTANRTGA